MHRILLLLIADLVNNTCCIELPLPENAVGFEEIIGYDATGDLLAISVSDEDGNRRRVAFDWTKTPVAIIEEPEFALVAVEIDATRAQLGGERGERLITDTVIEYSIPQVMRENRWLDRVAQSLC